MAFDIHSNFGYATVTTAPSPAGSGTTLVLATATFADFPDPGTVGYNVVFWPAGTIPLSTNSEIVRVVTKGTNGTLNITREQESTTARDITIGDQCGVAITKKVITDIEDRIGSDSWVIGEVPNGTPNGTLTVFTVDNDFLPNSTMVFRDGQLMGLGTAYDYTEGTAGTITFTTAPATNSNIVVTYRKNLDPNGNADTVDGYHASATPTAGQIPVLDSAMAMIGNSLSRQAIINGNFDVWQRGTSIAMTAADAYTADRWYCETATAGTDKTVSRQDGTGVEGSYYCARVAAVQDVDALLTFSQALESQDSIKFRGQKVTLSFYARGGAEFVADNATLVSKIVTGKGTDQKVLAFTTSADGVSQNNTLTTSWVKFTCTTTNVIASDITQIGVSFSFTHAGSGTTTNYFEITQVQLCAGDVALPFMPKSYEEELRACMRYYEVGGFFHVAYNGGTNNFGSTVKYAVRKRAASPTIVQTNTSATNCSSTVQNASTGDTQDGHLSFRASSGSGASQFSETWTVSSEL